MIPPEGFSKQERADILNAIMMEMFSVLEAKEVIFGNLTPCERVFLCFMMTVNAVENVAPLNGNDIAGYEYRMRIASSFATYILEGPP